MLAKKNTITITAITATLTSTIRTAFKRHVYPRKKRTHVAQVDQLFCSGQHKVRSAARVTLAVHCRRMRRPYIGLPPFLSLCLRLCHCQADYLLCFPFSLCFLLVCFLCKLFKVCEKQTQERREATQCRSSNALPGQEELNDTVEYWKTL